MQKLKKLKISRGLNHTCMNRFVLAFFLLFLASNLHSQELLSVEEAVKIALENNYSIRIAKNELEIDERQVNWGNAGILPAVALTGNTNKSIQSTNQTRSDGNKIDINNARNSSMNYGVVLDWTLFNGFKMFARYDQLKELKKLGEAELQLTVLNRVSDVMVLYFDIVQQQQQFTALDSTRIISEQRLELAENRFSIGKSSKLEVLNAKVDLNTDRTSLLRQEESIRNAKIRLNELLARDLDEDFEVVEEIPVEQDLLLPRLEALAAEQNPMLQAQRIAQNIARLQLKQIKGERYPTISANSGYIFNRNESPTGFTVLGRSHGFNYGLSARMNIFDGFLQNQHEQVAKLELKNSEIAIEQELQNVQSQLAGSYQTYLTNVALMELEKENEAIARENLEITLEKFRIGTIPTIEFRTAQLNYINAIVRHSDARFQAKLSEINLKEAAGILPF